MVASNKQDKPKAQEVVITKKFTNQGEKNPKIVASPLPSLVANAKILDTNIDSLATKNHDVDLIPIVELDGNTILPDFPSDQSKIDNIREEASDANLCRVELNKDVVPIDNAQEDLGRARVATTLTCHILVKILFMTCKFQGWFLLWLNKLWIF